MRNGDRRRGLSGYIAGVKDYQICRRALVVDHKTDQPSLILGGAGMGRNENELSWIPTRSEIPDLSLASLKIMLQQSSIAQRRIGARK